MGCKVQERMEVEGWSEVQRIDKKDRVSAEKGELPPLFRRGDGVMKEEHEGVEPRGRVLRAHQYSVRSEALLKPRRPA